MFGYILLALSLAIVQARPQTTSDARHTECPAEGHWLLPHEYDCTKFYYCEYGMRMATATDCARGTQFSYELQVCIHPMLANCQLSGIPPSTEASTTSTTTAVPTTSAHVTTAPPSSTQGPALPTVTSAPATTEDVDSTTTNPTTEGLAKVDLLPNGCPADFSIHQLLPHETECNLFYYCNFGEKVIRECAPGTHFNAALQVCDWPENAGCANSGGEDNSEITTTEAATTSTTTSAPSTTDAATTITSAPITTETATTSTTTAAPSTTEAENVTTTTSAPTTTEAATTTTEGSAEVDTLLNGCPADFSVHQLLPHETDCNLFYYCNFGEKVQRECAPGTHFNAALQVCDWPENAGCTNSGNSGNNSTEDGNSTENGSNSEEDGGNGVEDGLLPNGCPADFSVHQLLPHKTECNLFYYCNFGEKVLRECAPGTHFNAALQVCDWPENAGCLHSGSGEDHSETTTTEAATISTTTAATSTEAENMTTTTSVPTTTEAATATTTTEAPSTTEAANVTTTTSAPTTTEATTTTTEGSAEVDTLPNGCPADFSIYQLLPHETNCTLFYYCGNGEKVLRECATGTHFNAALQVCDFPENAGCINSGSGEDNCETTTTEAATTSTTTAAPSTTEAEIVTTTTSAPTTTEAATTTEASAEVDTLPNGCPSDFSVYQLLPHETNCTLFYYCDNGEKVLRECATGTHFNAALQICDWPETAGCINSGSGEDNCETTTTEAATSSMTTAAPSTTEAVNVTTTTLSPTTTEVATTTEASAEVDTLPNGCPSDFSVYQLLPHETNCTLFYYCDNGEKVLRECATGTHFNAALQICDWPETAGCINSGSGEDNCETTTTEAATTSMTTAAPSTTEAVNVTTTTLSPTTTEAWNVSTTTSAPTTTETWNVSTTTSAPTTTEAWNVSTTTSAPSTTEAWNVSTTPSAPTTETVNMTTTTSVPPTTEAWNMTTITSAPTTTEAWNVSTTTSAPSTTEAWNVSTTTSAPTTETVNMTTTTSVPPTTEACNVSTTTSAPTTTEAWNVSTTTSAPTTETVNITTTTSVPPTTEADTTTTEGPAEVDTLPNGCPTNFSVRQMLPHETNCTLFYYCDYGEKVLRECAPGTHFNPTLKVCDWPENAGCISSGNSTEDGDSSEENESDTEDAKCAGKCNVLPWPHETDCDKFWRCDGKRAVLTVCSEGLHFNSKTNTCDFICNVHCERNAQATIQQDGVRIFLPWDNVDSAMLKKFIGKLNHE